MPYYSTAYTSSGSGGAGQTTFVWILATGFWDDGGIWIDSSVWID